MWLTLVHFLWYLQVSKIPSKSNSEQKTIIIAVCLKKICVWRNSKSVASFGCHRYAKSLYSIFFVSYVSTYIYYIILYYIYIYILYIIIYILYTIYILYIYYTILYIILYTYIYHPMTSAFYPILQCQFSGFSRTGWSFGFEWFVDNLYQPKKTIEAME